MLIKKKNHHVTVTPCHPLVDMLFNYELEICQCSKNAFLANKHIGSENPRAGKECNFNQLIYWVRKSSMGIYKECIFDQQIYWARKSKRQQDEDCIFSQH
jgi:hypothetical protein